MLSNSLWNWRGFEKIFEVVAINELSIFVSVLKFSEEFYNSLNKGYG